MKKEQLNILKQLLSPRLLKEGRGRLGVGQASYS